MGDGLKVYSARQVKLTIAGLPIDSGYDDGVFITISPDGAYFEDKAGTDGEVVRWETADKRANAALTLMQTSSGHARLSTLHNLDRLTPGGAGVGVFGLKDLNGQTLILSPTSWVAGFPEMTYGREPVGWEWPIRISHLDGFVGGQTS